MYYHRTMRSEIKRAATINHVAALFVEFNVLI